MDQSEALTEAKRRAKHYNVVTWVAYNPDSMILDWWKRYIVTDMPSDYAHLDLIIEVMPNGDTRQILSGQALVDYLKHNKCIDSNGVLMRWPGWLTYDDCETLVKSGLMTRKTYGPETYAHTEYKIK